MIGFTFREGKHCYLYWILVLAEAHDAWHIRFFGVLPFST